MKGGGAHGVGAMIVRASRDRHGERGNRQPLSPSAPPPPPPPLLLLFLSSSLSPVAGGGGMGGQRWRWRLGWGSPRLGMGARGGVAALLLPTRIRRCDSSGGGPSRWRAWRRRGRWGAPSPGVDPCAAVAAAVGQAGVGLA
jgi:hypothetical protein